MSGTDEIHGYACITLVSLFIDSYGDVMPLSAPGQLLLLALRRVVIFCICTVQAKAP